MPGKDVLFILVDRLAPASWLPSLNIVKDVSVQTFLHPAPLIIAQSGHFAN